MIYLTFVVRKHQGTDESINVPFSDALILRELQRKANQQASEMMENNTDIKSINILHQLSYVYRRSFDDKLGFNNEVLI